MMNKNEINFIIYHNPCSDGTGSAWAAWKYLSNNSTEGQVDYYPTNHGKHPPDVTGKNVLICDFSYPKDLLDTMIKQAKNLLIIDHHKTAQEALKDIPDQYKIFDMEHSGAYLTWKYFFPEAKVPLMIEYIQDRDIWTKELQYTDEYASWFFMLEHDVEVYDMYANDAVFEEMLKTKGVIMWEKDSHYITQAVSHATVRFQKIDGKRFFIGYVNSTAAAIRSDIGHDVVTKFKHSDFAAVYSINDKTDSTSFSLRSTDVNYDSSSVAISALCNGGGHRNASGVRVPYITTVLPGQVLDNNKLYWNLEHIYIDKLDFDKEGMGPINIVYCQSNTHKYDMGAYLLQDKYTDDKIEKEVQECIAIHRVRDENPKLYERIQIAAVWSYNPIKKITTYKIVTDPSLNELDTNRLLEHFYKKIGLENVGDILLPGFIEKFN